MLNWKRKLQPVISWTSADALHKIDVKISLSTNCWALLINHTSRLLESFNGSMHLQKIFHNLLSTNPKFLSATELALQSYNSRLKSRKSIRSPQVEKTKLTLVT